MRCQTCDYPLWNVAVRVCPECGGDFKPSDFEFPAGSVRFKCPYCATAYYGLSARGHLIPSVFDCTTCQRRIAMDEMALEPAHGSDAQHALGRNAWLTRDGIVGGFFRASGLILTKPRTFGRTLPAAPVLAEATKFAGIGIGMQLAIALLFQVLFILAIQLAMGNAAKGTPFAMMGAWSQLGPSVIASIMFGAGWIVIEAVLAHWMIRLLGEHRPTFGQTLQAFLYAGGACGILLWAAPIPCLGGVLWVGWFVWTIVSVAGMLRETHHISGGLAAGAAITARVGSIIVLVIAFLALLLLMPQALGLPRGMMTRVMSMSAQVSVGEQFARIKADTGNWPRTPLDPYVNDTFGLLDLLSIVNGSRNGSIGGLTSATAMSSDSAAVQAAADALAARMPAANVPFRMGSAVFLYPIASNDPKDWIVVVEQSATFIDVQRGDGREFITRANLPERMAAENARRALSGLPPMPDLSTVRDLLAPAASKQ